MRTIPTIYSCAINQEEFCLHGRIELETGAGFCRATVDFERANLPKGFEPELLSYVAITGYPDASKTIGSAFNPFHKSSKEFECSREIDLGNLGHLKTSYGSENRLTADEQIVFHVTGSVNIDSPIVSIAPVAELWMPVGRADYFNGEMTFTWRLKDGRALAGVAESSYCVPGSGMLQAAQMRVITFGLTKTDTQFVQEEVIRLYDFEEWNQLQQLAA